MVLRSVLVSSAVLVVACASRTPGAQPHDMSAASHETTAAQAERAADEHAARWTSDTSPTAEHLEQVARLRRAAADHRAASQALREAEKRACVGISERDRDESPFDRREDIASVEPLHSTGASKTTTKQLEGAVVTFRAVRGMTAQWLQRVVDCHLARNAALGHDVAEMPFCPLVPKGARATVTATSDGFAVAVRGEDSAIAREIARRAEALRPR